MSGTSDRTVELAAGRRAADARVERLARQLRERSFAVWPALYDGEAVARLRAALERVHREAGAPAPYGEGVTWLGPGLELSATGLVIHGLLGRAPSLARGSLPADAVTIVRGALGEGMHLEAVGGVISDHRRRFFEWHMHVGGIDDEAYRRRGWRPTFDAPQRVAMIVYLDEMRADTGQLLIKPRAPADPLEPPFPISARRWEGQVAVEGPAGTAVWMEQSTWHAVLPRAPSDTLRMFVGFWFAAAHATVAERVDASLGALESPDDVLRAVLPGRAR
ncbi:MAG: hypothetical protein KF729_17495 [Sandaracinaceae bacterium]|nr:hypothetical protein [Sandaracinaceae bacterium]